jgi:hypothetical protein
MAKRVTELTKSGKVITYKVTRARSRSEQRLIPASPAPRTAGQKIARALWG